jgi:hypothetical protein
MKEGKTVFSQWIDYVPDRDFRRCVARYGCDRHAKKLSCLNAVGCHTGSKSSNRVSAICFGAAKFSFCSPSNAWNFVVLDRAAQSRRQPGSGHRRAIPAGCIPEL